jgi:peptide deformylase
MLETMYHAPGVGLAATQVNVHKRLLVMDVSEQGNQPQVFINPELSIYGKPQTHNEGCLSVPGFFEEVTRPEKVDVKARDATGKPFTSTLEGLAATCIQHEVDHLNGKLFVDYISKLKANRIRAKLVKKHRLAAKGKT